MEIERILERIPEYQEFYTVDELDAFCAALLEQYPSAMRLETIGVSRKGHRINCMIMGEGTKNSICFACPHPNEPIGAMTVITLAKLFMEDRTLLAETGYTWYLIPCIDPDGTRLNEGWFKGPFDLEHYARDFYRPAGFLQVEWTFPIDYKGWNFDQPIPETLGLMQLIEKTEPEFVFSLHNAAFGGAYWYVTKDIPELNHRFEEAAMRQGVPLHLGETESPYIKKYSKSVHSMISMKAYIDDMEETFGVIQKPSILCGTCSADYINTICDCYTMMAELPYFYTDQIEDETPVNNTRREIITEHLKYQKEHYAFLKKVWDQGRKYFTSDNPFPLLVDEAIDVIPSIQESTLTLLKSKEYDKMATTAQRFDNLYLRRYFECLNLALMMRSCAYELQNPDLGCSGEGRDSSVQAVTVLTRMMAEVEAELKKWCDYLEEHISYTVIPIRKLVRIQVESALLVCDYHRDL